MAQPTQKPEDPHYRELMKARPDEARYDTVPIDMECLRWRIAFARTIPDMKSINLTLEQVEYLLEHYRDET